MNNVVEAARAMAFEYEQGNRVVAVERVVTRETWHHPPSSFSFVKVNVDASFSMASGFAVRRV